MPLLHPSQNTHRYISSAKWPQGLKTVFVSNVDTVWPLQPVYPGPERKNPVITTNINSLRLKDGGAPLSSPTPHPQVLSPPFRSNCPD